MREPSPGDVRRARASVPDTRPTHGSLRVVRVGVLAAVSLLLAVLAHRLGGGSVPSWSRLCLLSLLVTAAALGLTSLRLRLPLMVGGVGVGQVLLHSAMSALTAPMTGPLTVHGQHGSMPMDREVAGPLAGPLAGPPAMPAMQASTRMLLFHVVATLATAWLLARGEAVLWGVVARAAPPRPGRPALAPARWQPLVPAGHHVPTGDQHDAVAARAPPRLPCPARHRGGWILRPAAPCGPLAPCRPLAPCGPLSAAPCGPLPV